MNYQLTDEILAALRAVDTPTICNAIEEIEGKRESTGFTLSQVVCADISLRMVGIAKTATIRATVPSPLPPAEAKALRIAYYRNVAEGGYPRITVIQDIDSAPGRGAFWGEVNTAIHLGLGVQGVLTNGSIRDLDVVAPGFQLLAGSIGPNHAHVHVTSIREPVEVFGMKVRQGDLLHADRHGAVVIKPGYERELPRAIELATSKEAPVLRAARAKNFNVDALVKAWGEAADIH